MCNVEVSCQDNGLGLFQLLEICLKVDIPFLRPIPNSLQALSSIWHVCCNEIEVLKLSCKHPPLLIVLLNLDIVRHRYRLDLRQKSDTRVAFLTLAAVPVLLISLWDGLK